MKNISRSVLDRLKNKTKTTGVPYNQLLLILCQEEFLRRLSKSEYQKNFVLKGGLYIYILSAFESRMTVDMDFLLRSKSNNIDAIVKSIVDIISIETDYDFIEFEFYGVEGITVEKKYPGVSVKLIGKIGNTKTPLNMDIGIGDVIIPDSEIRVMQAQLNEFEDVEVLTYSLETTVAEKFDAILQRFELTSRMKDFYDIWYITGNFRFDGEVLSKAIKETLNNRGTVIQADTMERAKNLGDDKIILTRWSHFKNKMNLSMELSECLMIIEKFIGPIIDKLLVGELLTLEWNADKRVWE